MFWNQILIDLSLSLPVFYGTWEGSLTAESQDPQLESRDNSIGLY